MCLNSCFPAAVLLASSLASHSCAVYLYAARFEVAVFFCNCISCGLFYIMRLLLVLAVDYHRRVLTGLRQQRMKFTCARLNIMFRNAHLHFVLNKPLCICVAGNYTVKHVLQMTGKRCLLVHDATQTDRCSCHKKRNVQVSDTTGDAIGFTAGTPKILTN